RREYAVPIYFAFEKNLNTPAQVGANFFRGFLRQYVAYRRVDPSLCTAALTFHELAELALPIDYEPINSLLEAFERERHADETSFLRFCLNAPQKIAADVRRSLFLLIDCIALADVASDESPVVNEIARTFLRRDQKVAVAGLR